MTEQTRRVLDFLANPASYAHAPRDVKMVQTHASWVFIASPFVFKIKQPVNLGFLDFSTLELRHDDCEREVTLNRRLAEDVYLGVFGICDDGGNLRFGDCGNVIEWGVKMRELDTRFLLSHLLKEDAVCAADIDRVVKTLRKFYEVTPRPSVDEIATTVQRLRRATDDNLRIAREWSGRSVEAAAVDAIEVFTNAFYEKQRALLDSRISGGWIRDCHGDLHAEHIHITPGQVRIYDCIEFNTRFRYIDVANDVAFLAMDLDFNGRRDLSAHLVHRFSEGMHDAELAPLMNFYKCYRACVRGKVESLHSAVETISEAERVDGLARARQYYSVALRYAVAGSAPVVFVFMGQIASGKSALAESIAGLLGWRSFSSDKIRKELARIPVTSRPDSGEREKIYSSEMTARTYDSLFEQSLHEAANQGGAVADATFSRRSHRDVFRKLATARGIQLVWIEAIVSTEVARERLLQRSQQTSVVSDARMEDFAALSANYEAPTSEEGVIKFSNEAPICQASRDLLMKLAQLQASK